MRESFKQQLPPSPSLPRAQLSTLNSQSHIHVYCKNNQLFVLNADGTAHDQSHGVQIPNKVAKAIAQKFPDIQLPPNNLIECASAEDEADVPLEAPTDHTGHDTKP